MRSKLPVSVEARACCPEIINLSNCDIAAPRAACGLSFTFSGRQPLKVSPHPSSVQTYEVTADCQIELETLFRLPSTCTRPQPRACTSPTGVRSLLP